MASSAAGNERVRCRRAPQLGFTWDESRDALASFRELCSDPWPLTPALHDAGVALANRYGLHLYDALILAAALEAGCDTLLTEDMQDGQVIDGRLTIRNPFAGID